MEDLYLSTVLWPKGANVNMTRPYTSIAINGQRVRKLMGLWAMLWRALEVYLYPHSFHGTQLHGYRLRKNPRHEGRYRTTHNIEKQASKTWRVLRARGADLPQEFGMSRSTRLVSANQASICRRAPSLKAPSEKRWTQAELPLKQSFLKDSQIISKGFPMDPCYGPHFVYCI